jgi:hypothetical protein
MKTIIPTVSHQAFRAEFLTLVKRYEREHNMTQMEVLAILSCTVGQVLAMQDQTKVTAAMGLQVISRNIEAGNSQVIDELMNSKGSG